MLDPNFWVSEDISKLSVFSRLTFVGMISNADDEGKGRANANYLKSIIFPYDNFSAADVETSLGEILRHTSCKFYEIDANKYYIFDNWSKWQRVDKPQKSCIPSPTQEAFENYSRILPDQFPPNLSKDKLIEVNIIEDNLSSSSEEEARTRTIDEKFEDFWTDYPKKVSRRDALRAFTKLKPTEELLTAILAGLENAKTKDRRFEELDYTPHAATWLNGGEWEDELVKNQAAVKKTEMHNIDGHGYSTEQYAGMYTDIDALEILGG